MRSHLTSAAIAEGRRFDAREALLRRLKSGRAGSTTRDGEAETPIPEEPVDSSRSSLRSVRRALLFPSGFSQE